MNNISSRHHYIPRFLIKNFTNSNGEVYVFDKLKQKILGKTFPPKSLFWEKDRNTMEFKNGKSSIIEDDTYSKIDEIGNEAVKYLNEVDLNQQDILTKSIYQLQIFILNLFWRIPNTDNLFDQIFESIINDIPLKTQNMESLNKHNRTYMFIHTLNETIENLKNAVLRYKIIEFEDNDLIISDNPVVYEYLPRKIEYLDNSHYIFPIFNKRAFIQNNKKEAEMNLLFKRKYAYWYNAISITQSKRYSASS